MKGKAATILATMAIVILCVSPFVMMLFEQEQGEAIFAGLAIGSVIGSILGIVAMVLNKGRSKLVIVLSLIPICFIVLFLVLAIPYYFYK